MQVAIQQHRHEAVQRPASKPEPASRVMPKLNHPEAIGQVARTIRAVDLFCGAGGTSTGLAFAIEAMRQILGQDLKLDLTAINHWERAIQTHEANHAWAKHLRTSIENIEPWDVVPGGWLDLLVASPPCTHHSVARGGKPVNDQLRSSAWHILHWIQRLESMPRKLGEENAKRGIGAILIENVPEFRDWGPVDEATGKPIKRLKGRTFRDFIRALRGMGYTVAWKILNAADYGDPTSRKRLFIMARKGRKPIAWPRSTHSKDASVPGTRKWRSARDCIDWSIPGRTIFGRKRPLSPNTRRRIARGIRMELGPAFEPLAVAVETNSGPVTLKQIVDAAIQSGVIPDPAKEDAFLLGQHGGSALRPVEEPMMTVATGGAISLIDLVAFLVGAGGAARQGEPRSIQREYPTLLTNSRLALARIVGAMILPPRGINGGVDSNRMRSLEEAFQTILASRGGGHLVEVVSELQRDEFGVLVPQFGERDGQDPRYHSVDDTLPAVTSHGAGALARIVSFLTSYFKNGSAESLDDPLRTQTTKDRRALIDTVLDGCLIDVHLRMLEVHELAAGMSFPSDYKFAGTRQEQIKQIGNAVAVRLAQALCLTLLTGNESAVLDITEDTGGSGPSPAARPVGVLRQPAQQTLFGLPEGARIPVVAADDEKPAPKPRRARRAKKTDDQEE